MWFLRVPEATKKKKFAIFFKIVAWLLSFDLKYISCLHVGKVFQPEPKSLSGA